MNPHKDRTSTLQPNVNGLFYVDEQCLACELCTELAPQTFAISDALLSFVKKQPESPEEIAAAEKAAQNCCVDAIKKRSKDHVAKYATERETHKVWWEFWR